MLSVGVMVVVGGMRKTVGIRERSRARGTEENEERLELDTRVEEGGAGDRLAST